MLFSCTLNSAINCKQKFKIIFYIIRRTKFASSLRVWSSWKSSYFEHHEAVSHYFSISISLSFFSLSPSFIDTVFDTVVSVPNRLHHRICLPKLQNPPKTHIFASNSISKGKKLLMTARIEPRSSQSKSMHAIHLAMTNLQKNGKEVDI